jgi:O-antigen ligase
MAAAVALPWLNPFSGGPSPNTPHLLLSGFCTLMLVLGHLTLGRHLNQRTLVNTLFAAWLVAALIASAMGLLQYFGLSDALWPWVSDAKVGQAYANLRQRNQFASLTSIGLVAVLYLASPNTQFPHSLQHSARTARVSAARAKVLDVLLALVLVVPMGILAMANAASQSRTGTLQWLLVVALASLWTLPGQLRGFLLACGALVLYAVAVVALPMLLSALQSAPFGGLLERLQEPGGCESRRVLWANVLELIAQKPWLGWGWGELKFAHFTHPYSGARFCSILDNAHNLPLHLAVTLGVPIAAACCAAVGWAVWRGKPWAQTDAAHQAAWSVLALIALHSLVEYPLWYGPFQMATLLCIGVLYRPRPAKPAAAPMVPAKAALTSMALTAFLAVLAYIAWDYTRISQPYLLPAQRLRAFQANTLEHARASRLFTREALFADITTRPLTAGNAREHYAAAQQLLHFSPEPIIVQTLLDSAELLRIDNADTRHWRDRFQVAYPLDFANWKNRPSQPKQ